MSPLVESIRIENKQMQLTDLHNERLNNSLKNYFNHSQQWDISQMVTIPDNLGSERYKCRIEYTPTHTQIDITAYHQRSLQSLKIVENNTINYQYKKANRILIDALYAQKEDADDILIVKNGMISDTSFCNILLFDGKNWYTPSTPLLHGVQRKNLIISGLAIEKDIHINDLKSFQSIKLINAMLDFQRAPIISIKNIF